MRPIFTLLLILLPALPVTAAHGATCADTEATRAFWASVWQQRTSRLHEADTLAPRLLPCLASPNPVLRDEYGFGLFVFWLRGEHLDEDVRKALFDELLVDLRRNGHEDTLRRSFAALVLSELLRADSVAPFLDQARRDSLLTATATALAAETDYRGLDPELGWVHPIAHQADLLWRFALHNALRSEQVPAILTAVYGKASQTDTPYHFNEPDRLARVVAVLLRREATTAEDFRQWLTQFRTADGSDWSEAFRSGAGMIRLHNSKLFLRALDDQLADVALAAPIRQTLDELIALFTALV